VRRYFARKLYLVTHDAGFSRNPRRELIQLALSRHESRVRVASSAGCPHFEDGMGRR
jgi:hypothetical protein